MPTNRELEALVKQQQEAIEALKKKFGDIEIDASKRDQVENKIRLKEKRWVINKSDEEYVEMYKGKEVRIPPRGKILMTRKQAVMFLGQYRADYDPEHDRGHKPLAWAPYEEYSPTAQDEKDAAIDTIAENSNYKGNTRPLKDPDE